MIRCELAAGEGVRAAEVLRMAEARAFPPAGALLPFSLTPSILVELC